MKTKTLLAAAALTGLVAGCATTRPKCSNAGKSACSAPTAKSSCSSKSDCSSKSGCSGKNGCSARKAN